MSALDRTIKCGICGRPYKFYAFSAADQSACRSCVREAEQAVVRPDTPDQIRRRMELWR